MSLHNHLAGCAPAGRVLECSISPKLRLLGIHMVTQQWVFDGKKGFPEASENATAKTPRI